MVCRKNMAAVETEMLSDSSKTTCVEKIYVDDEFFLWYISIGEINGFSEQTDIIQLLNLRLKI